MVLSRRFAQVSSDEEEDVRATRSKGGKSRSPEEGKRKTVKLYEDFEEEKETEEEEEEKPDDASPVGESVKVTGKGKWRRTHFLQFEYDGNKYNLEDPVLLVPEDKSQKPYDITQTKYGSMMILGQWFYRPEEAEKKGGGNWQSSDTRELFYIFHRDEVPAESVMHRCVVYFVPAHKQLPKRKVNPGFVVRKVYDTVEKKLWKLTDKDYEDTKQHEIDLLVEKSMSRLGDLPDLEPEEVHADLETLLKAKRSSRKVNIPPVDVRKEEDAFLKPETPGSAISSEYHSILQKFNSLTGDAHRDKCLAKLLEAVQNICYTAENKQAADEAKVASDLEQGEKDAKTENGAHENPLKLALHVSLASDYHKYNQRMRALVFNLKNTALLARRLLNGELEPAKILSMSPTELKEGLTAKETEKNEPDDAEKMQMTDARCSRCSQIKVGLRISSKLGMEIAIRDEVSTLTIDSEKPAQGTESEDVEKDLTSPREAEKKAKENESFKTTNDTNVDNNPETTKKPE
ncbi:hypothetical protein Bca52824_053816 [Brassica carinata]|uniref:Uncharacterized protein n=1 Tax=Brassica carinata TaxID=52824 RepID=A0A8X7R6B4_BRACI|nr:hypothetical protein Bca52824_053816 [Brassica carinata]